MAPYQSSAKQGDRFHLSGQVTLFGALSLGGLVDISDAGWNLQLHFHDGGFDFMVGLTSLHSAPGAAGKEAPVDFSLDASVNLEGLNHLEAELIEKLKAAAV